MNLDYTTAHTALLRYDATPPANVAITATGQASQFWVEWQAQDVTSGIASYTVEYSGTAYAGWQSWLTNTVTTGAVFSPPTPGTDYVFRVTAFDWAGNRTQATAQGTFHVYLPLVVRSPS